MPLGPLTDLLHGAQQGGISLGVRPDLCADADPAWRPLSQELVAEEVRRVAARWEAPPHVAAALWWKGYSYWATLPVTLGWALNRRVPLMSHANVVVRPADDDDLELALREPAAAVLADAPCAAEPGAVAVRDEEALLESVRNSLLRGHLAPVIRILHDLTRVGERTLWGSVAEAVAHPLVAYGEHLTGEPAAEWERRAAELLDALGRPVAGLAEVLPGAGLRRRTCCLWVALPDRDPCPSCCVTHR